MEDLEECARGFSYERYLKREGLNQILKEHARITKAE